MTKQELANCCIEKQEEKKYELEYEPKEYTFYKELTEKYNLKSLHSIFSIPMSDVMIAFLGAIINDKNFSSVERDIKSFKKLFDDFGGLELSYFAKFIIEAHDADDLDMIRESFEENNSIKIRRLFEIPMDVPRYVRDALGDYVNAIINGNREGTIDMSTLIYYFDVYYDKMLYVLDVLVEIDKLKTMVPMHLMSHSDMKKIESTSSSRVVTIRVEGTFEELDSKIPGGDVLRKKFGVIKKYADDIISTRNKAVKSLQKEVEAYDSFLAEVLKLDENKEIKNFDVVVEKIPDKKLRVEYLKLVYEHNNEEYRKIDSKLNELNSNSSTKYLSLLQKHDIKKDDVEIKLVMRNTVDEVSDMLMFLNNITKDKRLMIKAIETSDIETVVFIKELVSKCVLNEEVLKENTDLFIKDSDTYKSLVDSIEYCKAHNIELTSISKNPRVLLNNDLLDGNLGIIDDYFLTKGLNRDVDCSFLGKDNLTETIDCILELGYEGLLEKDLSLLNEDNWKRIYVLKAIGVMPKTKEELIAELRRDPFIVPSNSLDNYIHNVVSYCDKDFMIDNSFIADYYNSDRTLNVNGIVLSKQRILRNGTKTFQSIIKGSILSKDEIDILIDELGQKTYKIEE